MKLGDAGVLDAISLLVDADLKVLSEELPEIFPDIVQLFQVDVIHV